MKYITKIPFFEYNFSEQKKIYLSLHAALGSKKKKKLEKIIKESWAFLQDALNANVNMAKEVSMNTQFYHKII